MFVDKINIALKSGKGGGGMTHLKSISGQPHAGMDGGDGGFGGSVYVYTDHNLKDLAHLSSKKTYIAENGQNGQTCNKTGKKGNDLIIKLPLGSIISDENGNIIFDLEKPHTLYKILEGGRGGYGNAHFVTSQRQVIRFAELGEPGSVIDINIELKMIADLAIIGLPNAGKSTFISSISNARPKIADYPFTTLTPHPGVVKYKNNSFVACDIPGLIENAHKGKGLGIQFLKHIERCSVVLHMISIENEDIYQAYQIIENELKQYSKSVYKKPRIIAISKIDVMEDVDTIEEVKKMFKKQKIFFISSATHKGIEEILEYIIKIIQQYKTKEEKNDKGKEENIKELYTYIDVDTIQNIPIYRPRIENNKTSTYTIQNIDNTWIISGKRIEQIAIMTNQDNIDAMQRLYDVLHKIGAIKKLQAQNASLNDIIKIADKTIELKDIIEPI